jgi:hypothetical protein
VSDQPHYCVVCGVPFSGLRERLFGPPAIYRLSRRNQDEISCCSPECARVLALCNALADAAEAVVVHKP